MPKSTSFLEEFVKRAQMALDPAMAMGGAPPMMGPPPMGGAPMGGMPMGAPPMMGDPMAAAAALGGAMPPAAPAPAAPDPAALVDMMAALGGGAAPGGEAAAPAAQGDVDTAVVPAALVEKAMEVADSALELAQAKGEESIDALSTNAAGPMVASGALDNLTPEEILALKETPPAAPVA